MNDKEILRFEDDYQDPDTYWKTTHTKEAAALSVAGFEVLDVVPHEERGDIEFIFEKSEEILTAKRKYWNEELELKALQLQNKQENFLSLVKSLKK